VGASRSVAWFAGVSLRTQELYALVFMCRYLDLFFSFISLCAPRAATLRRARELA
jgi:hypothetical protein